MPTIIREAYGVTHEEAGIVDRFLVCVENCNSNVDSVMHEVRALPSYDALCDYRNRFNRMLRELTREARACVSRFIDEPIDEVIDSITVKLRDAIEEVNNCINENLG